MTEPERKKLRMFVDSELFDLTLYQELLKIERDDSLKEILYELTTTEKKHLEFWQEITTLAKPKLSIFSKIKLNFFLVLRRIFGPAVTILILEMIEIYGTKKYFLVWQKYKKTALAEKLREILQDEFEHEDKAISQRTQRKINVDKIRSAILGFNDGFVEIFGAVAGFLAAFPSYFLVGFAGFIVGLAGSFSMAASTFLSAKSGLEIEELDKGKKEILQKIDSAKTEKEFGQEKESPLSQAFYVGLFYFLGAILPVSPFLLGAENLFPSILIGFFLILILSFFTAFFAGDDFLKRLRLNLVIVVGAILVTYSLGYLAKMIFGIEI